MSPDLKDSFQLRPGASPHIDLQLSTLHGNGALHMQLSNEEDRQDAGAVTQLLQRAKVGDDHAASELMPLIYRELHSLAARYMQRERPNHTLQPTVLVHEAFLQLVQTDSIDWQGRAHFFALAARAMRRILIDHARSAKADKRPGGHQQVELRSAMQVVNQSVDILALHEALERLAAMDKRQADIVEMHFFGGLTFEEISEVLGLSLRTVQRNWALCRAWLNAELTSAPPTPPLKSANPLQTTDKHV